MYLDFQSIILTLIMSFLIFAPLLTARNSVAGKKGHNELFQSKWFGIPFILLLLFGNYISYPLWKVFLGSIAFSISISFIFNVIVRVNQESGK